MMLRAQVVPLAVDNEWVYLDVVAADTIRVTITKSDQRELRCTKGKRKHATWHDSEGHLYLAMPGGIVLGSIDKKSGDVLPLLLLPANLQPGGLPSPGNTACSGDYTFVGFTTVSAPAGEFDNCLIYDDRKIHRIYIKPGIGIVKEERYKGKDGEEIAGERVVDSTRLLVRYRVKPEALDGERTGR